MMNAIISLSLKLIERGKMPDSLTRWGIRRLCAQRLRESAADPQALDRFVESMNRGPVAPVPEKANEQHYELPEAFFGLVLGEHRKYSSCVWPDGVTSLDAAEAEALSVTCDRAELADGMAILELGCGWGSLTLWMAAQYPNARITAVSNSASQRAYILGQAEARGLDNVTVITADMNDFVDTNPGRFDRIVSVEMFEHMRNYRKLLDRISTWLAPGGKLFVHIFVHRALSYPFEADGADNWMGRYFFTGGLMPGADLLRRFDEHMTVSRHWTWDGTHYERTANAWLHNLDRREAEIMPILADTYGENQAKIWLNRWRVFFMACAELFGHRSGAEWQVGHYLLEPVARPAAVGMDLVPAGAAE
jgi:cyclopropane-fatty-acyl-phospholipid synthase